MDYREFSVPSLTHDTSYPRRSEVPGGRRRKVNRWLLCAGRLWGVTVGGHCRTGFSPSVTAVWLKGLRICMRKV
jgi:hypothetical protein